MRMGVERGNIAVNLVPSCKSSLGEIPTPQKISKSDFGGALVEYTLDAPGEVAIRVYDLSGLLVRRFHEVNQDAGLHACHWDGLDELGKRCPAGVYIVRVQPRREHGAS